ncbi:hypothetical protein D3C78_1497740 [compost metagenome]
MLSLGDALGFIPLAVLFLAAVGYIDTAVLAQAIARFGLHAVTLEEHRQSRQFIPSALVALQVDLLGARRCRVIVAGAAEQGQGHAGKQQCSAQRHG